MHQENSNSQNFTQLLQLLPLACCSIQGVLSIDADRPMIFDILFGDIVLNGVALLAVAVVIILVGMVVQERLGRRKRRQDRGRQEKKSYRPKTS